MVDYIRSRRKYCLLNSFLFFSLFFFLPLEQSLVSPLNLWDLFSVSSFHLFILLAAMNKKRGWFDVFKKWESVLFCGADLYFVDIPCTVIFMVCDRQS